MPAMASPITPAAAIRRPTPLSASASRIAAVAATTATTTEAATQAGSYRRAPGRCIAAMPV